MQLYLHAWQEGYKNLCSNNLGSDVTHVVWHKWYTELLSNNLNAVAAQSASMTETLNKIT